MRMFIAFAILAIVWGGVVVQVVRNNRRRKQALQAALARLDEKRRAYSASENSEHVSDAPARGTGPRVDRIDRNARLH